MIYTTDTKDLNTNIQDGEIDLQIQKDSKTLKSDSFNKEKDLVDFITININRFTKEVLNDDLLSFEIDKPIDKQEFFSQRGRRVDIFIIGNKKTYIIECKNPKANIDNRTAIGQVLDYGRDFVGVDKELIILTTQFDINTYKTIKHYNLPIRYIFFDKTKWLEIKEN